ncbi:MAG: 50S ribosomal protein L29 [Candidatus Nanoarchaeia archaeon]|nr:50S ribosomal protein L29 [Candidatus Nanoarchaeia archaeon]MDD5587731.1 50S ribosomal protein L29 [Candidatus Nanoarchaeia archaeon]
MKTKELRKLDEKTMKARLEEIEKELMKLNAQVATGTSPENPGKIKSLRKTIAKILTLLNEKKIKGG